MRLFRREYIHLAINGPGSDTMACGLKETPHNYLRSELPYYWILMLREGEDQNFCPDCVNHPDTQLLLLRTCEMSNEELWMELNRRSTIPKPKQPPRKVLF